MTMKVPMKAGDDQQVEKLGDRPRSKAGNLVVERNTFRSGDDQIAVGERTLHVEYFALHAI
jgi:hypothetical protein